jgi:hypothetical protein
LKGVSCPKRNGASNAFAPPPESGSTTSVAIRSSAPIRARWSSSTPARAVAPWFPKSRRKPAPRRKKETEEDLVLDDDIDIDDDDDADVDIDDDDVLDDDDDTDTVALDDLADVACG